MNRMNRRAVATAKNGAPARRWGARVGALGAAMVMVGGCAGLLTAGSAAAAEPSVASGSQTFDYQDHDVQTFRVPDDVTSITIVAQGGGGGDPASPLGDGSGGAPAVDRATFAVTPGATYQISVGGAGQENANGKDAGGGWGGMGDNGGNGAGTSSQNLAAGGGGGGATTVQDSAGNILMVAGGGGGAGGAGFSKGGIGGTGNGGAHGTVDGLLEVPGSGGGNGSGNGSGSGGAGGAAPTGSGTGGSHGSWGGGDGGGGGGGYRGGKGGSAGGFGAGGGGAGGAGMSVIASSAGNYSFGTALWGGKNGTVTVSW